MRIAGRCSKHNATMKIITKWMLVIHQYLGFGLSLLFVIWFLSGFVMMYSGFPTMTLNDRLQNLPVLTWQNGKISPAQAASQLSNGDTIKTMRMGEVLHQPVYRIVTTQNKYVTISAETGELLPYQSLAAASLIAEDYISQKLDKPVIDTLNKVDQWMAGHKGQGYLPRVYRFKLNDPEATYLYISGYTGEVVQKVTARQRLLAWLGPIPHWIYFTILLQNRPVWTQVVIWLSFAGSVMCLAGIFMGLVRYKKKKDQPLSFSPYKKKWFRWHHYTGFIFGLFVFTWILSGFFSMRPFNWSTMVSSGETRTWNGGDFRPSSFTRSPAEAIKILTKTLKLKEVHLIQVLGVPHYLGYQDELHTAMLRADDTLAKPTHLLATGPLIKGIQQMIPNANTLQTRVLNQYDEYYYSKHFEKRLPVLKLEVNDAVDTWYYVDLHTGQIVLKLHDKSRMQRWLYHGLHSLDFSFLLYKRPLWDIVVLVLMAGGLLTSGTGLVLTYKWLVRKIAKSQNAKPKKRKVLS